ncbi:MAG: helix-turn-helix transcriptional regulator [Chloroflexi bacterium]|nr:helix-turn-helix transcriptional regulator [Chloroflexota bacterium]
MTEHASTVQIFKALAHPARLRILEALEQDEACVCHLEALLGLRQPYISQQLAVLRQAGLVSDRQEGLYVFYQLADERVPALLTLAQGEATDASRRSPVRPLPHCPCPKCQNRRG